MSDELLTNAQMSAADRRTIESGTEGIVLMRRAGQAVADIVQSVGEKGAKKALVFCGPGNNGGDGFVIARILKDRGWEIWLACLKERLALTGDAALAAQLWDGNVLSFEELAPQKGELIIDAVFGTGFTGKLEPPVSTLFDKINAAGNPVVAVDIPSGVSGDDGSVDPHALKARATVTFHRKKMGHVLYPGAGLCGEIHVADIGISAPFEFTARENRPALWRRALPSQRAAAHKYDHGLACIYAAPELTGATRLAAEACARMGAGLVNVIGYKKDAALYRTALPAHILVRDDLKWDDPRVSVRLYGPGGLSAKPDFESKIPTVLDADALTGLPKKLAPFYVLTPHEGEFEKVFPKKKGSKADKTLAAAKQMKAVIVHKGADTVIAAPDGRVAVNANAPSWLATAGTGDVLAGMITGFLAQGMPSFEASCAAVWVHGETAKRSGPGLVAADLPDLIPGALQDLLGFHGDLR